MSSLKEKDSDKDFEFEITEEKPKILNKIGNRFENNKEFLENYNSQPKFFAKEVRETVKKQEITNNVYLQKLTNEFTFDKSKTLNLACLKEEHGKAY